MKTILPFLLAMCGLVFLAACDKSSSDKSGSGGVGILDLERVAKATGWDEQIHKGMQETTASLRKQAEVKAQELKARVVAKKNAVAKAAGLTKELTEKLLAAKDAHDLEALPLSKAQREDLLNTSATANQEAANSNQEYQAAIRQRQAELVGAFRNEVNPIIRRLAQANGFSQIVAPNDNIIYADPANDLTEKVIDELQAQAPASIPELAPPSTEPTTQASQPTTEASSAATEPASAATQSAVSTTQPTTQPGSPLPAAATP